VVTNSIFAGPDNIAHGAARADRAHQVRPLAAWLDEDGIRVNGINLDGVARAFPPGLGRAARVRVSVMC
jgi:hypothetical protein